MIQIRKAQRKQSKLRIGMSSPSGAGKTFSSLLIAKGLAGSWEKVGLIDSENGRGDLYADFGCYNIITLKPPFTPESYIEAIKAFENAGMEVIIIDSVTHEWEGEGGCLQMNERLAVAKYKGNTWSAWSETTPRHQKFIDAITSSSCHIITTVRNKVETIMTDDKKVKKIGTKEVQREGFEYELTVNFNIDRDTHTATPGKDNTRLFEGKEPFIITEETGKKLYDWVMEGAVDKDAGKIKLLKSAIEKRVSTIGKDMVWLEGQVGNVNSMSIEELEKLVTRLDDTIDKMANKKTNEQ